MNFESYDLSPLELSSQDSFETVRKHQFNYGLKTAMESQDATIVESAGSFELRYTPCDIHSDVWHGDCAADVLLSGKALGRGKRTVEFQSYDFPEAGFKGAHYKLILKDTIGNKKIYCPVDHSQFYGSLNPMRATKAVDTEFDNFEEENLIGDMKLDRYVNFEEFDIDGRPALTMIGMHKQDAAFIISVCVYEQDGKGNVVRRYESSYTFPSDLNGEIDANELKTLLKLNRVHVTENGRGEFQQFQEGIVKDKTINAFISVMSAYSRGKKVT